MNSGQRWEGTARDIKKNIFIFKKRQQMVTKFGQFESWNVENGPNFINCSNFVTIFCRVLKMKAPLVMLKLWPPIFLFHLVQSFRFFSDFFWPFFPLWVTFDHPKSIWVPLWLKNWKNCWNVDFDSLRKRVLIFHPKVGCLWFWGGQKLPEVEKMVKKIPKNKLKD